MTSIVIDPAEALAQIEAELTDYVARLPASQTVTPQGIKTAIGLATGEVKWQLGDAPPVPGAEAFSIANPGFYSLAVEAERRLRAQGLDWESRRNRARA